MNFSPAINRVLMLVFSVGLIGYIAPSQAEIYKQVDKQGRVTYSNVPAKGAKKMDLDPLGTFPAIKPKSTGTSTNASKIDPDTQKKRDDVRRKILEQELAEEEKLLEAAKQTYNGGEPERLGDERHNYQRYLDRTAALKETVQLHEKNVAALKQELAATPK